MDRLTRSVIEATEVREAYLVDEQELWSRLFAKLCVANLVELAIVLEITNKWQRSLEKVETKANESATFGWRD